MIYPTEATGDDDFTFVVTAQDEEGQGRVSSNSLTVEVNDFMNPIFFFYYEIHLFVFLFPIQYNII